jgi:hypothetical protein
MLTKADDFPVHQLPEPIATSGTDRNFYDRYFFNGYSPDGAVYFAVALGVYPHLNVMDGAFSVIDEGVQHNLHASRLLNMERMDTKVGPISVEVVQPLKVLRVRVGINAHGIKVTSSSTPCLEEPRFTIARDEQYCASPERFYAGWIEVAGKRIEIGRCLSRYTRSLLGRRPIGLCDPQRSGAAACTAIYGLVPLNTIVSCSITTMPMATAAPEYRFSDRRTGGEAGRAHGELPLERRINPHAPAGAAMETRDAKAASGARS